MSNSSVVKIKDGIYVDERYVRSLQRQTRGSDGKTFSHTIMNVEGVEIWVGIETDEIARMIHWI